MQNQTYTDRSGRSVWKRWTANPTWGRARQLASALVTPRAEHAFDRVEWVRRWGGHLRHWILTIIEILRKASHKLQGSTRGQTATCGLGRSRSRANAALLRYPCETDINSELMRDIRKWRYYRKGARAPPRYHTKYFARWIFNPAGPGINFQAPSSWCWQGGALSVRD